ncbi:MULTISPECIES: Shedu anti-phage system protein SduA domain-containing protein [Clostridium]|uniref:Shedu anti-phage system protein SduA domain-containing protein n=1 Tax=Clostridium TaxID=1485 RepID=UPI000402037B|nr:Shedu anti-phage system protein SduA domain-containing protein [Clostridium cadaveris]MDU4950793.1 DUF4263 domain-containing protein [Clostridium sp.]NME63707.1 DUF4263 domain-containing protein [Clostridium cadaveris]
MWLFGRDYMVLTQEERNQWDKVLEREEYNEDGRRLSIGKRNLFREYPKAARYNYHLFPNNYLDIVDLQDKEKLQSLNESFETLLDSKCNEQAILKYIKDNNAYYIIGSIFSQYNFGHHEAYIFPEFQLSTNYRTDYLLVGRSSGGYEFIFIELEHPCGNITKQDGNLGEVFRKGIEQTKDWKRWLDRNYQSLREYFNKNIKENDRLPSEFIEYDSTRFHYVVVAGRRDNFKENTYCIKREYKKDQNILLLHYDNLLDLSKNIIEKHNF